MIEELISGMVYSEFDDMLGPTPKSWLPETLSENIRMLISIKTITILTGEELFLPKSLIVLPFPSLEMKGLVKYIQWNDEDRRGGMARTSITVLFKENNDAIFYKYLKDLEAIFNDIAQKISGMESSKVEKDIIYKEINVFQDDLLKTLENFRNEELTEKTSEEFPEISAESEDDFDYRYKVVVCGDPSVGKTSTILRFTNNAFKRSYLPTIGVNISDKNVFMENSNVQLVLWDLAGQSKFQTMRTHFYQGADAIFLVFDLTRPKTLNSISNWHADINKALGNKNAIKIGFILGNKNDLIDERRVSMEDAQRLAEELNLDYIETSALTGENVNSSFYKIAETLVKLDES